MKKILLGLIVLLFIAGCANSDGDDNSGTSSTYYGGTQGVIAEFEQMGMEEDGTEVVWIGNEFPVEVTVKNKGEQTIEPGDLTVTLKGVDTDMFGITESEKSNEEELSKVSELNQDGTQETISFGEASLGDVTGLFVNADFFGSIEYKYKTYASVPKVCFKSDYQDESVCELSGDKTVHSSGAPVVVNRVTQEPSGTRRIALKFEVQNTGNGRIAPPDEEFNSNYDQLKFQITEGESSDINFECKSGGNDEIARFSDGTTEIICRSTEMEDALFTKQVTLELSYKYKDLIQKSIRIKNEPN